MAPIFQLLDEDLYHIDCGEIMCRVVTVTAGEAVTCRLGIEFRDVKSIMIDNGSLCLESLTEAARRHREKVVRLAENDCVELLSKFGGMISGYPYHRLKVTEKDGEEYRECDLILVNRHQHSVDFITLQPDGKVETLKTFTADDAGKAFRVTLRRNIGPILTIRKNHNRLTPSFIYNFVTGISRSCYGYPRYDMSEIIGNVSHDSLIPSLRFRISLEWRRCDLEYSENLYTKTYSVISHSTMDPWDDEVTERCDRYVWGTFIFDEGSLISFIRNLARWPLVSVIDPTHIEFVEPINKSEFFNLTGVYLFESKIESRERY